MANHRLIGNTASPILNQWQLGSGREARELSVRGHTRADNSGVVLSLVQHGAGIGRLISIVADPLAAAGALVRVLPELAAQAAMPVYAVMLQERHRLPELRACIEHWAEWVARV
ncbi:LysR substrate-binding domain-containing protein [Roseateles microcysteis]|uniref:LysR substrate-binding domain-containing protein n=1 Tax=Roseateles microcysteis TaxID=3119057 RepID=UPI002FE50902